MASSLQRLRATRAHAPGHVSGSPERRAIFGAALQQSEELFDSAAAVGPLARPIPLFYAVSQAGRAIAAARLWEDWKVEGHGLAQDGRLVGADPDDILRFAIKPERRRPGAFGAVAAALGLSGLEGRVQLGELWSALPDLTPPGDNRWPLALPVWPQVYMQGLTLYIGASQRGYVHLREQADANDASAITELLRRYPAATGAQVEVAQGLIQPALTPWGSAVPVHWPPPPPAAEGDALAQEVAGHVTGRVHQYRRRREHWLVPSVGDAESELPPLLLWWGLLFGLSILARYEPVSWQATLNPDASEFAVPLEEILDEALHVIPDLLYEAITGEAALLPARG